MEGQRVVAEVHPHLPVVVLHDLVESGGDAAAERALKIRERDDGDLRVGRAAHRALDRHAVAFNPIGGCGGALRVSLFGDGGRVVAAALLRQAAQGIEAPGNGGDQDDDCSFFHDVSPGCGVRENLRARPPPGAPIGPGRHQGRSRTSGATRQSAHPVCGAGTGAETGQVRGGRSSGSSVRAGPPGDHSNVVLRAAGGRSAEDGVHGDRLGRAGGQRGPALHRKTRASRDHTEVPAGALRAQRSGRALTLGRARDAVAKVDGRGTAVLATRLGTGRAGGARGRTVDLGRRREDGGLVLVPRRDLARGPVAHTGVVCEGDRVHPPHGLHVPGTGRRSGADQGSTGDEDPHQGRHVGKGSRENDPDQVAVEDRSGALTGRRWAHPSPRSKHRSAWWVPDPGPASRATPTFSRPDRGAARSPCRRRHPGTGSAPTPSICPSPSRSIHSRPGRSRKTIFRAPRCRR